MSGVGECRWISGGSADRCLVWVGVQMDVGGGADGWGVGGSADGYLVGGGVRTDVDGLRAQTSICCLTK